MQCLATTCCNSFDYHDFHTASQLLIIIIVSMENGAIVLTINLAAVLDYSALYLDIYMYIMVVAHK